MAVPLSQMYTVARHVLGHRLRRRRRVPLVLMLEPLLRCNLSCPGCGKIQHPPHVLRRELSIQQCLAAVDACGAPIVSVAGGEPLLYEPIGELVGKLIARGSYIYLCTNALLLKKKLAQGVFAPDKHLTFSVHLDGLAAEHDAAVGREGVYAKAVEAIGQAVRRGFRVTTNTTLFHGADPAAVRRFFDEMMDLGVESMTISPGYAYAKAPDQEHFLARQRTHELFEAILSNRKRSWRFNQSPLFLQFLMGRRDYACTPWGTPTYTIFGWQRPCYLLDEGYTDTFEELIDGTDWDRYGRASGNEECQQCMVHCGHEPTAVAHTFTLGGMIATIRAMLFNRYRGEKTAGVHPRL